VLRLQFDTYHLLQASVSVGTVWEDIHVIQRFLQLITMIEFHLHLIHTAIVKFCITHY